MAKYTRQDILDLIEEEDVKFIRLQFTDIAGNLKNMATTVDQIDKILGGRCRFNCAAVDGFRGVGYEELFLVPDLDTFVTFPWRPQNGKVARFICDIVKPDGTPFKGSSRYILKKVIAEAEQMGYTLDVGIKHEFFLFDLDENGEPTNHSSEQGGYFDVGPADGGENARRDMVLTLEDMGFEIEASHHEVAPAQHELASIYSEANVAVDNNQLVMQTLKRVACQHGLKCLLHEKPFAGVNGSGKHDNWSITTDDGMNLLEPGDTPNENIQFLLVLACIMKAVDKHADLLRQSASDVGNDHRLGANEAPPAIISIFLGDQLQDIFDQIEHGEATSSLQGGRMRVGVNTLPALKKDATDRNRTSPFAFTGNKFEFRMPPSSASISGPNFSLNTIVAEELQKFADELEQAEDFNAAVHELVRRTYVEHKRVIFDGNGYSEEWLEEATRRGLPNITNSVDAVQAFLDDKVVELFGKHGVLSSIELQARAEIRYEAYIKQINIEAKTMLDMASKQIRPAVVKYAGEVAQAIIAMKAVGMDTTAQEELLQDINENLKVLEEETERAGALQEDNKTQAFFYRDHVFKAMKELREPADRLELLVDENSWPLPTYGELLFNV